MVRYMHDLPSCPSTLLMRYITMKRKHLILLTTLSLFAFSALPGCGCGAVQTSVPSETVSVEESSSSSETVTHEEIPSATETEAVETESEAAGDVTVTEETASPEEIEIIEMDAIMYATTAVNVRQEASAGSEKIGSLSKGTAVHVTGITEDEQWYQISDYEDIEVGYISGAYLSSEKPSSSSSSSGSTNETASESTETQQVETPETQAPAETTPAPTTEAPNPGVQAVYDQMNQNAGQTTNPNTPAPGATPDNINGNMFGTPKDGSNFTENAGGILHAAD